MPAFRSRGSYSRRDTDASATHLPMNPPRTPEQAQFLKLVAPKSGITVPFFLSRPFQVSNHSKYQNFKNL